MEKTDELASPKLLAAGKSKFWRRGGFWLIFLAVIAVVLAVFLFSNHRSSAGDSFVRHYEELMRADVRGGQTPEETLKLFAEALRAGDIEAAEEYFILDDRGGRGIWKEALVKAKEDGRLDQIAEQIERAKPNPKDSTSAGDFKYVIIDGAGAVEATINLELNTYSNVWKIESL